MKFENYKELYKLNLDPQQAIAVQQKDGATLLLAVPGSGKTTVIISRIGYLIHCNQIDPDKILTLTFSKAAQNDMAKRFSDYFGPELAAKVRFRTIHSFCMYVINLYKKNIGAITSVLLENVERTIYGICRDKYNIYLNDSEVKEIVQKISYCKNMMLNQKDISDIKVPKIKFIDIFNDYESYKENSNYIDFDDQLRIGYDLLSNNAALLEYVQNKFEYINVDEAQDTSYIQHQIIQLITKKYNNIFMVGDEDQSIYGFRAAFPKALLDFKDKYKDATVMFLETNYRSNTKIVNVASKFITQNKKRINKNVNANTKDEGIVKHTILEDIKDQYQYIINNYSENKEVGILYRNNDSALPLINEFIKKGIYYQCKDTNYGFFSHFVVNDLILFMKLASDSTDIEVFEKLYYKTNLYITKDDFTNIAEKINTNESVFDCLKRINRGKDNYRINRIQEAFKKLVDQSVDVAIDIILNQIDYGSYIKKKEEDGYTSSTINNKINTLRLIVDNCNFTELESKLHYLKNSIIEREFVDDSSMITISTIHSSKGLEYDNVVIIDLVDTILPSQSAITDLDNGNFDTYEEEVRLLYVGMTRARHNLEIISYKKQCNKPVLKSCFIDEIFDNDNKKNQPRERKAKPKQRVIEAVANIDDVKGNYQVGTRIYHNAFKLGTIIKLDGNIVEINFDEFGIKTLVLDICLKNGIMELA